MGDMRLRRKDAELGNLGAGDETEQGMGSFVDAGADIVEVASECVIEKMPIEPVACIAEDDDEKDDEAERHAYRIAFQSVSMARMGGEKLIDGMVYLW